MGSDDQKHFSNNFIYVVNLENNNQVIAWDHIILDIEEDKKDGD